MNYDGNGIGCSACGGEVYPPGTTRMCGHAVRRTDDGRVRWTNEAGEVVHICRA